MKKIMTFLFLPMAALASSPPFIIRTTAHFCYEDYGDAVLRAEQSLQAQANLICNDREAVKNSEIRYVGGTCSVKLEATFVCQ